MFFIGNRGIFGTHPNIYGGVFLWKRLTAKSSQLFLQRSPIIDFSLSSKYGSWQYCQKKNSYLKDISQLSKTLFLSLFFILIIYILFWWKNQKNVLQKGTKDWTFEVYLLTGELSSWFPLDELLKMTSAGPYVWFLNFLSSGGGWDCFSQPSVLPMSSSNSVK